MDARGPSRVAGVAEIVRAFPAQILLCTAKSDPPSKLFSWPLHGVGGHFPRLHRLAADAGRHTRAFRTHK
jgi:hypothetical protein